MKHLPWVLLLLVVGADASSTKEAKKGFVELQATIARLRSESGADAKQVLELFAREFQRSDLEKKPFLAELQEAKPGKVDATGSRALVRFTVPGEESSPVRAVLLENERGVWRLACARSFIVDGKGLRDARGRKPARARMSMRTTNGPYGSSAYSFTYVSGDMRKYKNRVDIWFCHNQDFHVRGGVVDLGKKSLGTVKKIPLDASWRRVARAEAGHTYVMRVGPNERRDFFVAFQVTRLKRGVAELSWTLLAGGHGAPSTIHKPNPLPESDRRDGADGVDGLPGKRG
ncbi:MAG: hypothetical protein AAGD14_00615 [Planctomycetota bacterium]